MALSTMQIEAGLASATLRSAGVLLTSDLAAHGLTSAAVKKLLVTGVLVHLRRGAYAPAASVVDPMDRYRLFVQASMMLGDSDRVASHWSAAAIHGLPLIGAWPDVLHVIDPYAQGGSSTPLVRSHRAVLPEDAVELMDGIRVTTTARTVADLARVLPFAAAVAIVDEALRRRITQDELLTALDEAAPRYGPSLAARAIEFGDARAANAGESLSRARIHELGYVVPDLQVAFTDTRGDPRDVDFFWRSIRKIGEFDGVQKYTRSRFTGGSPPADVVVREKLREDALRPLVDSFDRWVWADAISPERFDRYLRDHGMPRRTGR